MRKLFRNWTKIVFIVLPLCIVVIDAAILFAEWRQPDSQKAIRFVKESKSRKENFTVQQYLYATIYHRKDKGEAITIEGWNAQPDTTSEGKFSISFTYTDPNGQHTAIWGADVKEKKVAPQNQEASDLSWQ
jgi:Tfp pilus assembly protein PilV